MPNVTANGIQIEYDIFSDSAFPALLLFAGNGDRSPLLSSIKVPTLVIHGAYDPLIPLEGGRDTAQVIPGARLFIIN